VAELDGVADQAVSAPDSASLFTHSWQDGRNPHPARFRPGECETASCIAGAPKVQLKRGGCGLIRIQPGVLQQVFDQLIQAANAALIWSAKRRVLPFRLDACAAVPRA
jgi:hypothetical protein